MRGWYPLTIVAVFDGINGYEPVATDPNYVAAGVPNQPLGASVGIPPICCPDISKGRIPLPLSNDMGYPVANRQLDRGYIQSWNFIVERRLPRNTSTTSAASSAPTMRCSTTASADVRIWIELSRTMSTE